MPAPTDYAYKSITDFSPGIKQIISANYPPGTAQPRNTFRCYSRDNGVLAPLPRRTNNYFLPQEDFPDTVAEEVRIIGLTTKNPVYWPAETVAGLDQNNTEILFGLETHTATHVTYSMWRYLRHYTNPQWREVWSESDVIDYDARVAPKHMEFQAGRSNSSAATEAGPIVTAFCVDGHVKMFPDDTDIYTDSYASLPGDKEDDTQNSDVVGLLSPDNIVAHQGRLVIFPLLIVGAGFDTVYATNESFYWTEPNDWTTLADLLAGNYLKMAVGWENPSGYQVFGSLSASELFMVKSGGGGVLLRGDIDNPNVGYYPFIRGSGLNKNRGVSTPLGLMYPVDAGGVWTWQGGDTAVHVTPYMEPDFWRPPPYTMNGEPAAWGYSHTQCAAWNEWVLFPNNYLFDIDREAMWRLDNPDNVNAHRWAVDWRGVFAYGAPSGMRDAGDPVFYEYNLQVPSPNFMFTTQPQPNTIAETIETNEVFIKARGKGRVTLRFTTDSDSEGRSVTFTGGDKRDEPYLWAARRRISSLRGSNLVIEITSRTLDDEDPEHLGAPEVHEVGWMERPSTPIPHR